MKIISISTQSEFDALPASFSEFTQIQIQNTNGVFINVSVARGNSSVVARGNSFVEAWENSSVVAWENSSVVARENSSVVARGNSSVEARGNSSVVARENSSVVARGNSFVEAWENSSVVARENSSVEAWENSSVVARENSSVEAWENSSVIAWENSSVVARGNSFVEAWENSSVLNQSKLTHLILAGYSAVWLLKKTKSLIKKSRTVTIIIPKIISNTIDWLNNQGIENTNTVILFKRVSHDYKTQENSKNETVWAIGSLIEHSNYNPTDRECGEGKFHACSKPYFCDEFRSNKNDKYIAIEIDKKDLYVWPNAKYPHKIAFRAGKVLYQCDKFGKKI